MAITGAITLNKVQGDLETTRGTAIAATRVLPILSGTLTQHIEDAKPVEQRNSYFKHYIKPIRLKRWVEIDIDFVCTEEDLIWYLQLGAMGHATAGTALAATIVDTTVDRYTFLPTATQGVTQTATLEVGDNTQAYICTMMAVDRIELGWSLGGMMTGKAHFIGAKAVSGSYTGALSAQGSEVFNGALAIPTIDTSTIGSTAVTAPKDMAFSMDNNLRLFYAPNGDIVPIDFWHSEARTMHLESTIRHTSDTENAAYIAQTQRKVRSIITGSAIAGSASSFRCVQIDWYGYWSEAPFTDDDGLNAQRMSGDAVYDATATHPWKIVVDTDTATIA